MTDKPANDALDRRLDEALAKYSTVEPRAGLEDRILANLRTQPEQAASVIWWRWFAVGAVAMLTVALTLFFSWRAKKPEMVQAPKLVLKEDKPMVSATGTPPSQPQRSTPIRSTAKNRPHIAVIVASGPPRLEQFPSPEPLSEQEKMLADYVGQFEEQAVLIARFNEDDLRRNLLEFGVDLQPDSDSNNF
jgi:hypothetical protein